MFYKKYNWAFISSDFNSPLIRNYIWVNAYSKWPKILDIPVTAFGIIARENQMEYLTDLSTWAQTHEVLKKKVLKDYCFVEELIDKTADWCEKLNDWTEKNIFNVDLSSQSGAELIKLYKTFIDKQGTAYAYGVALPILDFQEFSFIEGNLNKFLKSKLSADEYQKYFSVFTEPVHNSFAQDQEEDLLRLMEKFYKEKNWQNDVRAKSLDEIKELHAKFYSALKKHTKKYAWVYYVYMGPAYIEHGFLDFIKDYLDKRVDPAKKLKELEDKKQKIKKLKKEYITKLKPDKFNLAIINLIGKVIWAKPRRKDYQSKSYYHIEKLQKEIAKRLHISLRQVRSAIPEMLEDALAKDKELDLDKVNELYKLHICLPDHDKVTVLYGKEAEQFYKNSVKKEVKKDVSKINEIKGACAYTGAAKGTVKVVNRPIEMSKMKQGDILVSTATTPSIVAAMKKAGAIVTDEGGLTCHAAIVSREMTIPCVIGTKIATKVFKDGDKVEVDAEKGVVKKI